jgi:hypothetical protein
MFIPTHDDEYPKLTAERIAELQAQNLPHLQAVDMLTADPSGHPEIQAQLMAAAETYFHQFVKEPKKGRCVNCDHQLTGHIFGGTFTWGLAHGEGYCGLCKYPARAIHVIKDLGTLSHFVLQYHPDGLSIRPKENHAEENG